MVKSRSTVSQPMVQYMFFVSAVDLGRTLPSNSMSTSRPEAAQSAVAPTLSGFVLAAKEIWPKHIPTKRIKEHKDFFISVIIPILSCKDTKKKHTACHFC